MMHRESKSPVLYPVLFERAAANPILTARDWPGGAAKAVTLIILMLVAITFYLWFVSRGRRGREVSIV